MESKRCENHPAKVESPHGDRGFKSLRLRHKKSWSSQVFPRQALPLSRLQRRRFWRSRVPLGDPRGTPAVRHPHPTPAGCSTRRSTAPHDSAAAHGRRPLGDTTPHRCCPLVEYRRSTLPSSARGVSAQRGYPQTPQNIDHRLNSGVRKCGSCSRGRHPVCGTTPDGLRRHRSRPLRLCTRVQARCSRSELRLGSNVFSRARSRALCPGSARWRPRIHPRSAFIDANPLCRSCSQRCGEARRYRAPSRTAWWLGDRDARLRSRAS